MKRKPIFLRLTAGALADESTAWQQVGWQLRMRRRSASAAAD